ncbi:hypothetical protein TMA_130 [Thermus phage TMA]|uniref:hypothetical protein n=1 Tax=Thermus phage TMA TaxID=699370 RepID=UPI00021AADF1|nr:hypothetical protein TMA_130 [Thermus phage TMA]BAK53818.1 hypothetical protein TMA_130 [Thermus phage TMA]
MSINTGDYFNEMNLEEFKFHYLAEISAKNKNSLDAFYFFIEDSIEELIEFFSLRKGIPLTRFDLVVSLSSHERSRHKTPYSSVFKLKYKVLDLRQHLFNLPDLCNSVPTPHPSV